MGRYEFLMNRPAQRIREVTEKTLELLKINPKQYGILAALHNEGPASQREIGEMLKIDRSTMVTLTDDLEKKKALVRKDHPKDRRYYLLYLTASGKELFQQADRRVLQAEEDFLVPLTKMERQDLRKCLSKLFRYVPLVAVSLGSLTTGLMADQTTLQGREAVRVYRAKIQQESRATAESSKDKSQTNSHSKKIKEKQKEDEQDRIISDQLKKMPKEQRDRSELEYRTKRAEQRNKSRRTGAESKNKKG